MIDCGGLVVNFNGGGKGMVTLSLWENALELSGWGTGWFKFTGHLKGLLRLKLLGWGRDFVNIADRSLDKFALVAGIKDVLKLSTGKACDLACWGGCITNADVGALCPASPRKFNLLINALWIIAPETEKRKTICLYVNYKYPKEDTCGEYFPS